MKAINKYIEAIEVKVEQKTTSGIYLAESASDNLYEVVSIGEEVKGVAVGDRLILGPSYKGEKVRIAEVDHFFFPIEVVLGIY